MPRIFQRLQARLVDSIKRHAIDLSLASPTAEAWMLTGYLWSEECAEGLALARAVGARGPTWLGRLLEHQLADEGRHATLLRERLAELAAERRSALAGPPPDCHARSPTTGGAAEPAPRIVPRSTSAGVPEEPATVAGALGRMKLARLERLCEEASPRFARGMVVPLLACAARLEATGVRVFGRHLHVLERRGRKDGTTRVLREILDDERRHARSCAAALERLVEPGERAALAELQEEIARVDRSFGVTASLALWCVVAAQRVGDGLARSVRREAPHAERRGAWRHKPRTTSARSSRTRDRGAERRRRPGSEAPSAGAA